MALSRAWTKKASYPPNAAQIYKYDATADRYFRDEKEVGISFYYHRWILENTIPDSKHPWRLKNYIVLENVADKQQPKRLFEELKHHSIPAALIFRAGMLNIATEADPIFDMKKHTEWWLHFSTAADRTAAMLLL